MAAEQSAVIVVDMLNPYDFVLKAGHRAVQEMMERNIRAELVSAVDCQLEE
jgi:hypothetical protein